MKTKEAIAAVTADIAKKGISKNQKNTYDNYKFRGIDDVYNALAPILSAHGLVILPYVRDIVSEERASGKGGVLFYKTVKMEYTISTAEDNGLKAVIYGEAMDRGDKAINKAMAAAYKLLCFQLFCIPIEGQDSEEESHDVAVEDRLKTQEKQEQKPETLMRVLYQKLKNAKSLDELQQTFAGGIDVYNKFSGDSHPRQSIDNIYKQKEAEFKNQSDFPGDEV